MNDARKPETMNRNSYSDALVFFGATAIHPYPTFVEVERKVGDAYSKTRLTPRAKQLFSWRYERPRR